MSFDSPLFTMSLLVGSIFIIAGFILYKFPPKSINELYGYRTKNSMRNIERWKFAQTYSARLMMYLGAVYLLLAIPAAFISIDKSIALAIGLALLLLLCAVLFIKVEKALKGFK